MGESFVKRLKNGEALTGTIVSIPSPETAEVLALAGFDWLFIDMEHGAIDIPAAQNILQAADSITSCLIRIPSLEEVWMKKCLDIGASGIIVPHVMTAEDAKKAVDLAKYPPRGSRSVGIGRAHGYGKQFLEYMERANEDIAVIIQIEHKDAVENIDSIVKVPGIDALFIGPYDLSGSMGKTGQIDDAEVKDAISRVVKSARNADVPLGIFSVSAELGRQYKEEGFSLIVVGMDMIFLSGSAQLALAVMK
jgi:2-keto-3-deoxy-L-rhamnonate aldolase RhmA